MAKVRVQDATKDLSTNAGRMLENISRLRRQSQEMLSSLRRISDAFVREEHEKQEREAKEALQKQYEAAAQFMTAYSSEHAPEVPPDAPAKPQEAPRQETPAAEAPAAAAPEREAPEAKREIPARHPHAPRAPSASPIRVVRTKAEVEATEEQRRRAQQQQNRQRPPQQGAQFARPAAPGQPAQGGFYGRPAAPGGP